MKNYEKNNNKKSKHKDKGGWKEQSSNNTEKFVS